jgi:serine protease
MKHQSLFGAFPSTLLACFVVAGMAASEPAVAASKAKSSSFVLVVDKRAVNVSVGQPVSIRVGVKLKANVSQGSTPMKFTFSSKLKKVKIVKTDESPLGLTLTLTPAPDAKKQKSFVDVVGRSGKVVKKVRFVVNVVPTKGAAKPADTAIAGDGQTAPAPTIAIDPSMVPSEGQATKLQPLADGAVRTMGSLTDQSGKSLTFVANELIMYAQSESELRPALSATGGAVVQTIAAKDPAMPSVFVVRIPAQPAGSPLIENLPTNLQRLNPKLVVDVKVSDRAALGTLAAAAATPITSNVGVTLSMGMQSFDVASGNTPESPAGVSYGGVEYTQNSSEWQYLQKGGPFNTDVVGAWNLLRRAGRLRKSVEVTIVDAGFGTADGIDNPQLGPHTDVFGAAGVARCGGSGPREVGCVWHGAGTASTAIGVVSDGFGAAGVAGPVANGRLMELDVSDPVHVLMALTDLNGLPGRRVINLSWGAQIPAVAAIFVKPYENMYTNLVRKGNIVIAAAGNSGANVDDESCFGWCWESGIDLPCEATGVICVGALDTNSAVRRSSSNYGTAGGGDTVDIYAPGSVYAPAITTASNGVTPVVTNNVRLADGTSYAAPFVAGVAALVWAAKPELTNDQVLDIILRTASRAGDGIGVYPDAWSAVRLAIGGVPPEISIQDPTPNEKLLIAPAPSRLTAVVSDYEDGAECCKVAWTSDKDGALGSGLQLNVGFATPGVRTITATATDSSGKSTSASVTVEVVLQPIKTSIVEPRNGSTVFRDSPVTFVASEPEVLTIRDFAYQWAVTSAGSTVTTSTAQNFSYAFTRNGNYTANLTVTDKFGNSTTASSTFTVVNPPVTLTIGSYRRNGIATTITTRFPLAPHPSFSNEFDVSGGKGTYTYRWMYRNDSVAGCASVLVSTSNPTILSISGTQFANSTQPACSPSPGSTGTLTFQVTDGTSNAEVSLPISFPTVIR